MEQVKDLLCNERVMLYAIMVNTALMFFGGFWPASPWFEWTDALFTLIFLFEAMVKISRMGWKAYWREGWNKFDFIVLIVALPSLASPILEQTMATNAVLALRSMRLFKSLKMLRFIPNIHKLLAGLKLATRASLLVFIAFIVFLIIFAILSSTIFGTIAPEYFGNPAISVYSIFRLFTVEGWYEFADTIANNASSGWGFFARIYFSVLMFLGGVIGLSLINSIFVDAMAEDNNDEVLHKLEQIEKQLKELTESKNNNQSNQ